MKSGNEESSSYTSDDVSLEDISPSEMFLQASRKGNNSMLKDLIIAAKEKRIKIDINCKGSQKSNFGWTPLHLSSYFGHVETVQLLLENHADVDVINGLGDTPLHKAAFTGRQNAVMLLLTHGADVSIINGEGFTAKDLAFNSEIRNLIEGAEKTEIRKLEEKFLIAATDGDMLTLKDYLNNKRLLNIHCKDNIGNTALHCAAYRNHKAIAILLLQNGMDTSITNNRGQLASDLTTNSAMKELLSVKPIKSLQKNVSRFEGQLLKKRLFRGWKTYWCVLDKGVFAYFSSRADASAGVKRRNYKFLGGANVHPQNSEESLFHIVFADNAIHRLSLPVECISTINRQKWLNALQEHIAYSTHFMRQGMSIDPDSDDDDMDVIPLGSMSDALQNAQAHQQLLGQQVDLVTSIIDDPKLMEHKEEEEEEHLLPNLSNHLKKMSELALSMSTSLSHCLLLFTQQEQVRLMELKAEQEKSRVLEDALHVLAKEHHELERSVTYSSRVCSPRYYDTDNDEFYDAYEGDSDETLSNGSAEDDSEATLYHSPPSTPSPVISKYGGRSSLPVPMFSREEISVWSILKQCIGKELSKITMPVVFNEPLSFLQRLSEYMEYSYLLTTASQCDDPVTRLEYVTAFAVSALASNWERLGKPFNPLLGETYELERPDIGFRITSEQVSHHPPVSAFHADSDDFIFRGSIHPKLRFWGKSVEIQPKGTITVELIKRKEVYTWTNVNCCVHNIIVGKLWIEQYGQLEVVSHNTGLKASLNFKPAGWFSRDLHRVEGFITNKEKTKLKFIYGKWTDYLKSSSIDSFEEYMKTHSHKFKPPDVPSPSSGRSPTATPTSSPAHQAGKKLQSKFRFNSITRHLSHSLSTDQSSTTENGLENDACEDDGTIPKSDSAYSLDIPNSELLWQAEPRPEDSAKYYQFTLFAMMLNEIDNDAMKQNLCVTDSRLRPDIRKLEEGDIDTAAAEKNRLEEKQREARKLRKKIKTSKEWKPRWFTQTKSPYSNNTEWTYVGGYWNRDYKDCIDIF